MYDVAESLRSGFESAATHLHEAQRAVADANAGTTHELEGAMSQTARAAIFEEALLSAVRARFEEVKAVAK